MAVVWERSEDAFYADTAAASGHRYYLIVEGLPGGGWDWSVGRQKNGWQGEQNGTAKTIHEAMRAAEGAAI